MQNTAKLSESDTKQHCCQTVRKWKKTALLQVIRQLNKSILLPDGENVKQATMLLGNQ
jgi:hypothetical protein